MGTVSVIKTVVKKNRIEVFFKSDGPVSKFFREEEQCFWIEYNINVEDVPLSVAIIPFISNVLPIIWITNSSLYVHEIDKDFLESIPEIKHGYILQSRKLSFGGQLYYEHVVENKRENNGAALLFSGGVDAFATLFNRIDKTPRLIIFLGADLSLDDHQGCDIVVKHINETSVSLGLDSPVIVKTNFRRFLDNVELGRLVEVTEDSWWHGFQHGLAFCGSSSPVTYALGIKTLYIASSYTCDQNILCASDPVIDSHIRFASSKVFHDGYSMTRIEKVKKIVDTCASLEKNVFLRVCWRSSGGVNCCSCEKCIRTIFNIYCVGGDPHHFGFVYDKAQMDDFQRIVQTALMEPGAASIIPSWRDIKEYLVSRKPSGMVMDDELKWIYTLDLNCKKPVIDRTVSLCIRSIAKARNKVKSWINCKWNHL